MGLIKYKSKELYPNLKGAEYLEYESDEIPENVKIIKSNIFSSETGDCCVPSLSFWGWDCADGYHFSFTTPEAALKDYKNFAAKKN